MHDLIHLELGAVLNDWQQQRPIRTIRIGHVAPGDRFNLRAAHDYAFQLIEAGLNYPAPIPWDVFTMLQQMKPKQLSAAEVHAAESLAWRALIKGWKDTINGFSTEQQIELTREADA